MKFFYLLTIIAMFTLISCKRDNNLTAVELNEKASQFIMQHQYDKALSLLDQAIKVDSKYHLAYSNKVSIYLFKNDYDNAFKEIERLLEIKKDFAEGWLLAGLIIEKNKDEDRATEYYQKAVNIFTKRINSPNKSEQVNANKLNRAIAQILLGKKEEGYNELIELKEINNYTIIVDMFLEKTREEIVNDMIGMLGEME